ncbi:hypothetical protein, partial [uncultured Parabacteroides sp.]|uniref:hypothetical protein n=1 Tax=uncultured Parabacteroides sp. TaxID=512312 RepID=UPI0028039653
VPEASVIARARSRLSRVSPSAAVPSELRRMIPFETILSLIYIAFKISMAMFQAEIISLRKLFF